MRLPDLDFGSGNIERRLASLQDRSLNFRPESLGGPGWELDDYRQPLISEQPGPPEPAGSWETAAALSRSYALARRSALRP